MSDDQTYQDTEPGVSRDENSSQGQGSQMTRREAIEALRKSAIAAPTIALLLAPRDAEAVGAGIGSGQDPPT